MAAAPCKVYSTNNFMRERCWASWATVSFSYIAPPGALGSADLLECNAEGVCQWLGRAGGPRRSFVTEHGLSSTWFLEIFATKHTETWTLGLKRRERLSVELHVSVGNATYSPTESCRLRLSHGSELFVEVKHHLSAVPPLDDPQLQLLAANFSAFAVKELPYSSWRAPFRGECLEWALLAEHHDCRAGAHAGVWAALPRRPGRAPIVVAAFKGTDFGRGEEVLTDLRMSLVPCELGGAVVGRCAQGFLEAYQSVRRGLVAARAAIAEALLGHPPPELLITGHSLGAAMATLMLADLLSNPALLPFSPGNTTAWHFGSPMVGDSEFRAALWEMEAAGASTINLRDHVRAVAVDAAGTTDFITHFPACVPLGVGEALWGESPASYCHVGRRHYLSAPGAEPSRELAPGDAAAAPGWGRLLHLLRRGANLLHDERRNYLPLARSRANESSESLCSGRCGRASPPSCRGFPLALVPAALGGILVAVAARRCLLPRCARGRHRSPAKDQEEPQEPVRPEAAAGRASALARKKDG